MSMRELLRAWMRGWYLVLGALLVAAGVGIVFVSQSGTFTSTTVVVFTLPQRSTLQLDSGSDDQGVIAFAGAVATEVNAGRPVETYSSADAPYYGAGIREGYVVSLRNMGNQWVASYPSATLEIQVVGRSAEWVQQQQAQLLQRIAEVADNQQSGRTAADRITVTVEPLTRAVAQVPLTRTSRLAAWAGLFLAGLMVGTWAARVRSGSKRTGASGRTDVPLVEESTV